MCLPAPAGHSPRPVVVAIPARNEADELQGCLSALAAQLPAAIDRVVICLNNCHDDSSGVIGRLVGTLPFPVDVMNLVLSQDNACAGMARRIAMDRAASLAGREGILLTTDADARVPPDWIAANLAAIAGGADAVAGKAEIEPSEARSLSEDLHSNDTSECGYGLLLDEIRSLLDPDLFDPWPRHDEHSGASIAVTVAAYRRIGGMPVLPLGEDRAFFAMLRQIDAHIRHAPEVRVVVSARLHGRASGGMADTMRRRTQRPDRFLDARLEPACDAANRARMRGALRRMWQDGKADPRGLRRIAARLNIATECLASHFALDPMGRRESQARKPYFGSCWTRLQQHSPLLMRHRVRLDALPAETARARRLRDWLRRAADRADTQLRVAAE